MGAQTDSKSWHELPFWTLVKNYLRIAVVFFFLGWIFTRFVNWDILILQLHLNNLWLLAPESAIVFGGLWLWNWDVQKGKKKRKQQAQEQLQTLIEQARRGGEKEK